MTTLKSKAVIVDVPNLICRYHSVNDQITHEQLSNAIRKLGEKHGAEHVIAALDAPHSWREKLYEKHKQGRAEKSPKLKTLLCDAGLIAVRSGAITVMGTDLEADDVMAICAKRHQARHDSEIIIVSTDKDMYTCLSETVCIQNAGGLFTIEMFQQKYNVTPQQWPLYRAITGDTSDGHGGIKGLGEKAAMTICLSANTADEALEQAKKHRYKPKHNQLLLDNADELRLFEQLAHFKDAELIRVKNVLPDISQYGEP